MNSRSFVQLLRQFSFTAVFNPYRDSCPEHDHREAPTIRQANLERYLDAASKCGVEAIWIGRDCGYRGCRRTGIALTDEFHLKTLEHQFEINGMCRATIGAPVKERTATEVWKMIQEVDQRVFLWNAFPFHPYEPGRPMSNRCHTTSEFNECKELLIVLLEWLRPARIITIGADAFRAMEQIGFDAFPVRHPSYGGQIEFAKAIRRIHFA